MNQPNHVVLIAGLFGLLALPGCYTQLGMTRQEREPADREYTATEPDTSASYAEDQQYNNGYDQYADQWRPHVGFSYYYPSTFWPSAAFAFSYGNPWAFDSYYAYDPWLCGTPYVHYPYYGYGYYPSYYYPSYPYHYGYASTGRNVRHGSREFGVTRGSTSGTRGGQGSGGYAPNTSVGSGSELPRGSRLSSPQGAPAAPRRANAAVAPNGRTNGNSRGAYAPRSGGRSSNPPSAPSVRGSSARGGNSRGDARNAQPHDRTPQAPSAPPAGSRDGGTPSSPAPSYTPPPQHSAPPPASAPSGGSGGRGGNTRGRRP